ncbi:MAG: alpha/beta fold hydrolase, partial [Planctomycetes bacterium]|nr:alpha/beta fold hydrolase [Planctomycetota bacterium]
MPAITLDSGLEINYREAGQGETLVLVHGFTSSIWNWDPVWEALAARFRVLALDLPGHGGSSKPLDAPYGVPAFAMNLAEFLRKKEIVNFYLAGHSMGGMVAMTFVLDQAWRGFNPRGLILMATAAKSRDDEQRRQLIRLWRENLKEGKFDLPEKMLRAIFRLAFSPRYARAHAEIVDQAFAVATLVPDPVKLRLMEHLATEYDIRERVGEITLPALILQG